jgi:divalent metal cation (Fe/Co/Zn/Cd) transporter
MATIHAEVAKEDDIEEVHEEIDRLEMKCKKELGVFLVIHMDPIEVNNAEVDYAKEVATRALCEVAPECSLHDFRMVNGEHQINLIFDLVVPWSCKGNQKIELMQKLRQKIKQENEKYFCVITVEHSYIEKD